MVFFAIWWAWMNFTWFASAYDCDDVPYRLAVFVQIAGALVMAAGVAGDVRGEDAEPDGDQLVTSLMRFAMVAQWLRAAAADPSHRVTALRYRLGDHRRAMRLGRDTVDSAALGPGLPDPHRSAK